MTAQLTLTPYGAAAAWLRQCLELSATAKLGNDTSEAECVLAETYLELGELDAALEMAMKAHEISARAGNRIDLANATLVLGKLHLLKRDAKQGGELITVATKKLLSLAGPERLEQVRRSLKRLGQKMPIPA